MQHDDHVRAWRMATDPKWVGGFMSESFWKNIVYENSRKQHAEDYNIPKAKWRGGTP